MKFRATLNRRLFMQAAGVAALAAGLPFASQGAAPTKFKIGIVGSGNVGSNLGRSWARAGHQVMFSSRNLEDDKKLAAEIGANASAGTTQQAVAFGDVVLFAVPYGALPGLATDLSAAMKGKIMLDACNPILARDGDVAVKAREKGAGIATAEMFPGARLARSFNAIQATKMGAAYQDPQKIGMPFASDDAQAIEAATRLIRDIGFEPILVGGLDKGRFLMPGTPLAGEHTPEEVRKIAAGL